MIQEEKYEQLYHKAKLWHEQHKSFSEIQELLIKESNDHLTSEEIVKQIKLIHYANKRKRGAMIILTGSILLLIGFIMTVSNFYANTSFAWVMYGFTSAGLLVIFAGLYDCFG
jgi:hypothetical protein